LGRGLFQVDLAKRVGVSEMTIVNWEKGRTKLKEKNILGIEEILEGNSHILFLNLLKGFQAIN